MRRDRAARTGRRDVAQVMEHDFMARVCIIDDKDVMRDSLRDILGVAGHEVAAYADPQQALAEVTPTRFDAIVSDLKMPGMDGIDVLGR
jgi:CheY-like chemotaxis protein